MKLLLMTLVLWMPLAGADGFVGIGSCKESDGIEFFIEQIPGTSQGQFKGVFPSPDPSRRGQEKTVTEAMDIRDDGAGGFVASFLSGSFFAMVLQLQEIKLPAAGDFTFTNPNNRTYSCRAYSRGS